MFILQSYCISLLQQWARGHFLASLFKSLIRRSSRWTMMYSLLTASKCEQSWAASCLQEWFSCCVPAPRAQNMSWAITESKNKPVATFHLPCCGHIIPCSISVRVWQGVWATFCICWPLWATILLCQVSYTSDGTQKTVAGILVMLWRSYNQRQCCVCQSLCRRGRKASLSLVILIDIFPESFWG